MAESVTGCVTFVIVVQCPGDGYVDHAQPASPCLSAVQCRDGRGG